MHNTRRSTIDLTRVEQLRTGRRSCHSVATVNSAKRRNVNSGDRLPRLGNTEPMQRRWEEGGSCGLKLKSGRFGSYPFSSKRCQTDTMTSIYRSHARKIQPKKTPPCYVRVRCSCASLITERAWVTRCKAEKLRNKMCVISAVATASWLMEGYWQWVLIADKYVFVIS